MSTEEGLPRFGLFQKTQILDETNVAYRFIDNCDCWIVVVCLCVKQY